MTPITGGRAQLEYNKKLARQQVYVVEGLLTTYFDYQL